jgi:hypothetical protein
VINLALAAMRLGRLEEAFEWSKLLEQEWSKRLEQEIQDGIVEWPAEFEPMVVGNLARMYNSLGQFEKEGVAIR